MSKLAQLQALGRRRYEERQAKTKLLPDHGVLSTLSTPSKPQSRTNAEYQAKWREANRELHRERSRNSMRKLRAKA